MSTYLHASGTCRQSVASSAKAQGVLKRLALSATLCGAILQVHLGFYATEEDAARAYDRAAITKGARDRTRIITNMDIQDYAEELEVLRRIPHTSLVEALSNEQ